MSKGNSYYLVFAFALILSGCKNLELSVDKVKSGMPRRFDISADSTSAEITNWQAEFFDPNLIAILDSALQNNFDLQIALQKVEIAKAGIKFNKGIRLPELSTGATAGQRKFGEYTMDGVGNYDTQFSPNISNKQQIPDPLPDYYVGFQASWEIDLWGKLKNKKKAAASRFIASQYGRDLIITNLVAEIATSYFELIALDNEIQIFDDNIVIQETALELALAKKQAGKASELDVEMMTAQLLSSRATRAEIQQQVLEIETKLSFLCGYYPKEIARDTSYFSRHLENKIKTGIPSDLIRNRADIRQAEYELMAANADVKSAQAAFYPSLTINSALGLQAFNSALLLEFPASIAYQVLGGLSAPLLNRRKIKADLMAGKAGQKEAYILYEKTVVSGFREVYVAINKIKNMQTITDLKKQEVFILKNSITTSSELFKAGRANYLEVLTSQKNSLMAQIELNNYYKRQNIALVELYRAIGGGWK